MSRPLRYNPNSRRSKAQFVAADLVARILFTRRFTMHQCFLDGRWDYEPMEILEGSPDVGFIKHVDWQEEVPRSGRAFDGVPAECDYVEYVINRHMDALKEGRQVLNTITAGITQGHHHICKKCKTVSFCNAWSCYRKVKHICHDCTNEKILKKGLQTGNWTVAVDPATLEERTVWTTQEWTTIGDAFNATFTDPPATRAPLRNPVGDEAAHQEGTETQPEPRPTGLGDNRAYGVATPRTTVRGNWYQNFAAIYGGGATNGNYGGGGTENG